MSNGRQIRYTGRMGPDVGARLSDATLETTTKAVLAGFGFENGGPASIGAGKKGRIWATLRLKVNEYASWCKRVGAKLVDENIDPEEVLRGTLIPRIVSARPPVVPVGVDWPVELLELVESATKISFSQTIEERPGLRIAHHLLALGRRASQARSSGWGTCQPPETNIR